jgi:hypothetical protein
MNLGPSREHVLQISTKNLRFLNKFIIFYHIITRNVIVVREKKGWLKLIAASVKKKRTRL